MDLSFRYGPYALYRPSFGIGEHRHSRSGVREANGMVIDEGHVSLFPGCTVLLNFGALVLATKSQVDLVLS